MDFTPKHQQAQFQSCAGAYLRAELRQHGEAASRYLTASRNRLHLPSCQAVHLKLKCCSTQVASLLSAFTLPISFTLPQDLSAVIYEPKDMAS